MLPVTPQMLQSLGKVTRAPGPRVPGTPGQIVAIPVSGNGATPKAASSAASVQLPVVPVVLSAPQRLNLQQQQPQQQQQSATQTGAAKTNFISPILDHSGSRKRQDTDHEHGSERCVKSTKDDLM